MRIDKFIFALIGVVVLAYLFPYTKIGPLELSSIGTIGISAIFFFYGLKLTPAGLKSGLRNWRLHVIIQLTTFVVFPLLVLPFYAFVNSESGRLIWLGMFFLAVMPSTVSSSVVMVSIAKGNVPAALFNASISGLIGIAAAPLWLGLFLSSAESAGDLSSIYGNLLVEIVLPVGLGLLLQRYWGEFARKHARELAIFDKSVILLIVYESFVRSFTSDIFASVGGAEIVVLVAGTPLLFFTVYFLTGYISRRLNFGRDDRITAQFCGTKKSLVHGSVFLSVLFANSAAAGIILVPLMVFHAFQILAISVIASNYARDAKAAP